MEVLIKLPHINSSTSNINNNSIIKIRQEESNIVCEEYIKFKIFEITFIPIAYQYLKLITTLSNNDRIYELLLRVNGGKGGFGSLLKSTGTRVGQKKTTNFDACRDLSGRRLRHVNNETRIKEWLDDDEARKSAMSQLKKKMDESKLNDGKQTEDFNDTKFQKETEDLQKKLSNSVEQGLKLKKEKETTVTTTTTTTTTTKPISMYIPDFSDDEEEDSEEEESEQDEKPVKKQIKVTKTK